jgi:hypothetical protein
LKEKKEEKMKNKEQDEKIKEKDQLMENLKD